MGEVLCVTRTVLHQLLVLFHMAHQALAFLQLPFVQNIFPALVRVVTMLEFDHYRGSQQIELLPDLIGQIASVVVWNVTSLVTMNDYS